MFDYAVLRVIWWLLLGVLLAGFAIMDGFDLGVAALLPFVARNDVERRITINTIGPVWEGNQVWIILGAGAIFAAWPAIYAVTFSGFYLAMMLLLATFIIRPVAFKYRSKMPSRTWRTFWDWSLSLAGLIASLVFGVAIGNVLQGVPFHFDAMLQAYYTGTFWDLFNPFALLCGAVSVFMLLMHGATYLSLKTAGDVQQRARTLASLFALFLMIAFAAAGYWVVVGLKGYVLAQAINESGPSNPLHKVVVEQVGAWAANFSEQPWMLLAPMMAFTGALLVIATSRMRASLFTFVVSAISVFGVVTTVGLSMFPFILPSSSNPTSSLLVWDASSSKSTLEIMLFAAVVFVPIILAYTTWVFWVLRGKVTAEHISRNDQSY